MTSAPCRVLACSLAVAACGNDLGSDPDGTPTYLEDVAPILRTSCLGCHAAPTAVAEARNCVRLDRWDSVTDAGQLCPDPATAGMILGIHDASAMLVDQVVAGEMPFGGPTLAARDVDTLERWRDAGFPRRSPNAPPTIQFISPAADVTVCNPACTYTVSYIVADPDSDPVAWSLGWAGGGKTGTFAGRLAVGAGSATIDAGELASGTYAVTASLDDGTARVAAAAPGSLTIPPGHNASPSVTVVSPNGGESYYAGQPIAVTWNGGDADGTSLSYDVVAVQGTAVTSIASGLTRPVGTASATWMAPAVTALTSYRIRVTAHDGGSPSLSAMDGSDADFKISPPPQAVSFAGQLQPIFTATCVDAQCHDASMPQQGLNLTAGAAYRALVDVSATQSTCSSYKLVRPGQPDQSYLIFKLAGSGACFTGSRMPKGAAALSATQIQLFRDWIANGAPNN